MARLGNLKSRHYWPLPQRHSWTILPLLAGPTRALGLSSPPTSLVHSFLAPVLILCGQFSHWGLTPPMCTCRTRVHTPLYGHSSLLRLLCLTPDLNGAYSFCWLPSFRALPILFPSCLSCLMPFFPLGHGLVRRLPALRLDGTSSTPIYHIIRLLGVTPMVDHCFLWSRTVNAIPEVRGIEIP
jgi:hypothetical protein